MKRRLFKNYGIGYIDLKIIIESYIGLNKPEEGLLYLEYINNHIYDEEKVNLYNFLSAKLQFIAGNYYAARRLLGKITIEDFIYYCEAKLIELRISVMESNYEAVLSVSENVYKYLKKHPQIGESYLNAYKNFTDAAREYILLINKNIPEDDMIFYLNKLSSKIKDKTTLYYAKDWLLELLDNKSKNLMQA